MFNVQEIQERLTLVALVTAITGGDLDELLKNSDTATCFELARIWDKWSRTPVGVMFKRPKFEDYALKSFGIVIPQNR